METKKIIEVDSVESLSNNDTIFVNSNNSLKQILKSNLTTDGGYYSPSVDTDGNLSWTASKTGMPDVPGTNIKGPKGDAGATGPKGEKGDKGDTGTAGYTPVRGTDYWTAADQQAIVNDVLAALPTWEGGSY